jgi:hypothetical protein
MMVVDYRVIQLIDADYAHALALGSPRSAGARSDGVETGNTSTIFPLTQVELALMTLKSLFH